MNSTIINIWRCTCNAFCILKKKKTRKYEDQNIKKRKIKIECC